MPDGGAVRALDVVGIDLELRLAVNRRFFGQHQVLVALSSIGLLSVLSHNNAAVEDRARFVVEYSFVKLSAGAVMLCVIDHRVIVDVLVFGCYIQTIERALGAFAIEHDVDIVANQPAAKRNRVRIEAARLMLMNLNGRDMKRVIAFRLQLVVIHHRIRPDGYFSHRIVEINAVSERDVILYDGGLAALACDYQAARMRSDRLIRSGNKEQVNRSF